MLRRSFPCSLVSPTSQTGTANSAPRPWHQLTCAALAFFALTAVFATGPDTARGQDDDKRQLEHKDYDLWNTTTDQRISNDGKWVLFNVRSGDRDKGSTLKIRRNQATKEYSIPRATGPQFTFDSKYVIYRVTPDPEQIKTLRKAKVPAAQLPGTTLEVLELESGEKFSADRVGSFRVPAENARWLAYLHQAEPELKTVSQAKTEVVETYEVTPAGLKKPEKKLKLKKRPQKESAQSSSKTKEAKSEKESAPKKSGAQKSGEKKSSKTETSKSEADAKSEKKPVDKKKSAGTTLVLHDLETGISQTYPNVTRFWFSKAGERLAFMTSVAGDSKSKGDDKGTADSKAKSSKTIPQLASLLENVDGVFVVELDDLEVKRIADGRGEYKNLAFSEDGSQLAFLTNKDDYDVKSSAWSVYHWKSRGKAAVKIAGEGSDGIPSGWWVSPNATAVITHDGKRVLFETAPIPESVLDERDDKTDEKDDDEKPKAKLDVWHWQDPQLQPQQLLQAAAKRNRNYEAVYNIKSKTIHQLATEAIPSVSVDVRSPSSIALATSNVEYEKTLSWDIPGYQDLYLMNLDTGDSTRLIEKTKFNGRLSPEGNFVVWFDSEERKWYAISTASENQKPIEISKGIEYPLQDELHDTPSLPRAYGTAGWLANDAAIWIYDRYDIWQLDPSGKQKPVCVTKNLGRENKRVYRYQRLDSQQRFIDEVDMVYLSTFDETTKASGFASMKIAAAKPAKKASSKKTMTDKASKIGKTSGEDKTARREAVGDKSKTGSLGEITQLIMLDESLSRLQKARDTEDVIFTRSTFRRCPDLWSSQTSFKKIYRISDINPQQDQYRWGTAELVHWDATDGQKLDGILYKPDGFDPSQKYPMMVYFYERNSDTLHRYYTPSTSRSIINHSFYVSRGYLVFVPDIPYETGEPGPSAANAILPGVEHLVKQGFVDEAKIGMQGHSWGGYQTAYLVTQTDMFACAESGAPVSNMTSAYGGIRWSSGMSRMFQYERTQSRIGEDLWAARQKYIANSPVFFADQVNTPLLILHNDEDGAVPWYQGIEMFVALRRLEKPSWLLNYNGEPHWVMKDENQLDFTIRMQQFFDHYLLDAPEPEWMAYGVPGVDKGQKFGLELLEPEAATKPEEATEEAVEQPETGANQQD